MFMGCVDRLHNKEVRYTLIQRYDTVSELESFEYLFPSFIPWLFQILLTVDYLLFVPCLLSCVDTVACAVNPLARSSLHNIISKYLIFSLKVRNQNSI